MPVPVYRDIWPGLILPPRSGPSKQLAAITFVNGQSATTGAGATTGTVTKPTGTVDGDFLILTVNTNVQISNVALSGWTLLVGGSRIQIIAKMASSEGASYAPTWTTGATAVLAVAAFHGVDTSFANAILAHSPISEVNLPTDVYATRVLLFQATDYMHVSCAGRANSSAPAFPSGFSVAVSTGSASSYGGIGYKPVTNTENAPSVSWDWANGSTSGVWAIALRPAGSQALSCKTARLGAINGSGTSMAMSAPAETAPGDLLVVLQGTWIGSSGGNSTLGTPSGWTKKGTDQYLNAVNRRASACILYRIADGTGTDNPTVTCSISSTNMTGMMVVFGTGSDGPDPSLPGTMGQALDDPSSDNDMDVPAMTLSAYSTHSILVIACDLIQTSNRPEPSVPSGFTEQNRGGSQADLFIAAKLDTGAADPPATTWPTPGINFSSLDFQFAVHAFANPLKVYSFGAIIG
jgi:hypothetical protein